MGLNEYYEQVLRVIASLDDAEIWGKCLSGEKWYEIDNIQDLDIANSIFCKDAQSKLKRMKNRYGGYWRFTDVQDYCYLVNPYYPPKKMLDEMRASFDMLVTEYPSGMAVNSMLAGKMFGIPSQYIAVGNGASELIKALTGSLIGKVGVIKPTFDEYVNRIDESNIEVYNPDKEDYQYTCEDIVNFFANKDVSSILLINPDNPSGNYLCYNDLKKMIAWAKGKSVSLIIDESFSDFANEPDNSLLNTEVLNQYDKLYVVKSISKSYGVPGLRLGVIASSDSDMISNIKKDVSIWNINSLAEFYMQICEKYEKDYDLAMEEFRRERQRFAEELSMISWLHVIPTQANFCMLRLLNGMTAKELSQKLLTQFNILIKDLSEKLERDDYVRIAIKDTESNNKLLNALNSINI
jgi:histidinol-phosphate/aromatic aminotransferase/cobyric acid decarboxylase-like protein